MAKIEKVIVNGIGLNENEKKMFDLVQEKETINPNDIATEVNKSVASVRSTLARLNKTYGLIGSKKSLVNDKAITIYTKEVE